MDVAIDTFLAEEGFGDAEARELARAVLETEGLTRPGKARMAESKLPAARAALEAQLWRSCAGCKARTTPLAGGRLVVEVPDEACPHCGGSDNRRAVVELVAACKRRGVERLLIVGGTATLHRQMEALVRQAGGGVSFRFVDGAEAVHTRNEATAGLQWAHLAVVWGSTPLPHKVSQLYTGHPLTSKVKVVTVTQRGIAGLCQQVQRALG